MNKVLQIKLFDKHLLFPLVFIILLFILVFYTTLSNSMFYIDKTLLDADGSITANVTTGLK